MLYLFTFCVDIGRHNQADLLKTLNLLINSLDKTNEYELHIFTNFPININRTNIIIHKYFDNTINFYTDKWYNLSFNKINIYKYLYDKYNIDFIWIDLDTIVSHDISYINKLCSCFIDCGGTNKDSHSLIHNSDICIPRNLWIQGNFWKLNINLFNILMKIHNEIISKNLTFNFDLQSLFTYYFYYILDGKKETLINNKIFIIGRNIKQNVLNGLCIWDQNGNTHANLNGLNNLYYENKILKSKFYPDNEIHIVSFTFMTLKNLYNNQQFKKLFM